MEDFHSTFHLPCIGSFLSRQGCNWKQEELSIRKLNDYREESSCSLQETLPFLINKPKSRFWNPSLVLALTDLKGSSDSKLLVFKYPDKRLDTRCFAIWTMYSTLYINFYNGLVLWIYVSSERWSVIAIVWFCMVLHGFLGGIPS